MCHALLPIDLGIDDAKRKINEPKPDAVRKHINKVFTKQFRDNGKTMKQNLRQTMIHRRKFGRLGLMATSIFGASTFQFNSSAMAYALAPPTHQGFNMLIKALRSIGKEATIALAQKLETVQTNSASCSLHLRSAGLDVSDADILANALLSLGSDNSPTVGSFSVSYNPLLGDEGIIALANSLPQTVREIGFVGCNMSDMGAEALLTWAKQAPHLKMLCIEDNKLSPAAKQDFMDLRQKNSGLYVVV